MPPVQVYVNSQRLPEEATIDDGRVLVPLRSIMEALGASVQWDAGTETITAQKQGLVISLKISSKTGYCNNKPVSLDTPAKIKNGRTMVPARFVSESFGSTVQWDNNSRTVYIK
ncbi:copper amine oxidase N-terminal domain-containing protein [Desulfallas thermosapovorans]|uniref:copper amine oxidase N-terminal domain-containing protein n=1 Tax=Desulfallas thermosapovorans TaxID=58137 RepID=UPI003C12C6CC